MAEKTPRNRVTYVDSAFQVPADVVGIEQSEKSKTIWVEPNPVLDSESAAISGIPVLGVPVEQSTGDVILTDGDNTAGTDFVVDGTYEDYVGGEVVQETPEPDISSVEVPEVIGVVEIKYVTGPSGAPMATLVLEVEPVDGAERYEFRVSEVAN